MPIVGESLAGLFVLETFFLEHELFDTYIAFDPSIWWNDQKLLAEASKRLREWAGGEKTLYVASSSDAAELSERLGDVLSREAPPKVHWSSERMPSETHATIYHPGALRAFRSVFKPAGKR